MALCFLILTMTDTFLPYHEPSTAQLLTLASFLLFLPTSVTLCQYFLYAGLLGPLALGIIYGVPLANILMHGWQETFLALGYLGLIILVLEGGPTTQIALLRQNLVLSFTCALTGIGAPIGLSVALLSGGFGYPVVEAFVLGAALSATSLGTTFVILNARRGEDKDVNIGNTRVGTVIMSAAMIDDVVGCTLPSTPSATKLISASPVIMASVVQSLDPSSDSGSNNIGWIIG